MGRELVRGHHVPAYSVLFPPLGALIGPAAVGALAAVAAAATFAALAEGHFGPAARPGALWFATLGVASQLFAGRLTFVLGVAVGLAALLALRRELLLAGAGLAVLTGLASAVAALFLALAASAVALARITRRAPSGSVGVPAAVCAGALAPVLALAAAFPEGGREPFYQALFITTLGMTLAFAVLLPRRSQGALWIGVALAVVGVVAAYELATPVGSNVARLGGLCTGPLLLCVLLADRRGAALRAPAAAVVTAYALWHFPPWYERGAVLGAAALLAGLVCRPGSWLRVVGAALALLPFAIFHWSQTFVDLRHASHDPATRASYFRPLIGFLDRADRPRVWRVEVPQMREHWESVEVARWFPLARGWERQLDTRDSALFYHPHARRRYRGWLRQNVVRFVALPDAPLDYASGRELAILRHPPSYLKPRWRSAHWRVYEVTPAPRLVVPERGARIAARSLEPEAVTLSARARGSALVRVRYTRYWRLRGGCVARRGNWTRVTAARTGTLRLSISVTPGRLLAGAAPRCS